MPNNSTQARTPPPPATQGTPSGARLSALQAPPLTGAVVEMVRVAVPAAAPVMLTGVVEPKLSVGRCTAPAGLVAITALSATLPVKPLAGVIVTVEVFPVVAPGATLTVAPPMVKEGGAKLIM